MAVGHACGGGGHAWGCACVVEGVHGRGGGVCGRGNSMAEGACMAGGMCGGGEGACMAEGVHGRETCKAERGVCVAGGHAWQRGHVWQRGVHGRGQAWQGACVARGVGMHAWQEMATAADGMHPTGMNPCINYFHSG